MFKAHSVFQGKHKLLKNPECKNYIQYSEHFQGKRKLLKNRERWKNFQYNVYSLGVICVIWASVVCNLDQSRD